MAAGLTFGDAGHRNPPDLLPRAPPPADLGHRDGVGAEQALHAGQPTTGPIGGRRLAAPEAELAPGGGGDLVGGDDEAHHPAGGPAGGGPVEPPVELPAHPVGHGRRAERTLVAPHPFVDLALVGLGGDHDPAAGQPVGVEPGQQLLGQALGHEGGHVDALGGRVEVGGHLEVSGRRCGGGGSFVEAAGQPVGDAPVGTEAGHHVGGVERPERPQGAQAQADEHVGEVGTVEHAHRERGEEPR